jgi:porin
MRLALLLALLCIAGAARAGAEPALPDDGAGGALVRHLAESPRLFEDPWGLRSDLERLGVDLRLFHQQFLGWVPRGGAGSGRRTGHSGSYDLLVQADAEELLGWTGLSVLLQVKGQYDRSVNDRVGALSDPVDDADFDEPIYVDQLWAQQRFFGDLAALRLGLLEQQVVYDRNAYANSEDRQFMSQFLDNNGLVPLPDGLSAALLLRPREGLELAAGVADSDNRPQRVGFRGAFDNLDGATAYLELTVSVRPDSPRGRLPGHYRFGLFRDGRKLTRFGTTRSDRGHLGGYLSFDQLLLRESAESEQGLGAFVRFGGADEDVSRTAWFWSLGMQYRGLPPGRDSDVLAVGCYQAIASDRFRRTVAPGADRETGVEIYYSAELLPWLAVTPDLQYVVDPGAMAGARDAVVALLRFRVTF